MTDTLTLALPDPAATTRLAVTLSDIVGSGDCLCLQGSLGAGKSHLARGLIQHLQAARGPVEDVPSPTYTLVQTYAAGDLTILHADLYRLSDSDELIELGLIDALETSLSIIEWPDKLGDLAPANALWIALQYVGEARSVTLSGANWQTRLDQIRDRFLAKA